MINKCINLWRKSIIDSFDDSITGPVLSVFRTPIAKDLYIPYLNPKENDSKNDIRWFTLTDSENDSIVLITDSLLSVTGLHYTASDLMNAIRPSYLKSIEEIILYIDHKVLGLENANFGHSVPLAKYLVYFKSHIFSFSLHPCTPEKGKIEEFGRYKLTI